MPEQENYPINKEAFEVVLLKDGVSESSALPPDFKRIPVEASSPHAALIDDSVSKEKGWRPLFATKPGVVTDPEMLARQRELNGKEIDKTKV